LDVIEKTHDNSNKQVQALAQTLDDAILATYKLWPTNFIAYDLLHNCNSHTQHYTETEKALFMRRLEMRIDDKNPVALQSFLAMYANPVVNHSKYQNVI